VAEHDSVRRSYDTVARAYVQKFRDELDGKPLDRALLACLAEQADDGFEPPQIAEALETAGFCIQASLERVNYPGEVETRRAYLLARREQ
jgi:hypothetical protein